MTGGSSAGLRAGFGDPVSGAQATFRAALEAMAHPCRVIRLPDCPEAPPPLHATSYALALTIADFETAVWLDPTLDRDAVRESLRFHCGCPIVPRPEAADIAFIGAPRRLNGLDPFKAGTPAYPDRGATLVVQVDELEEAPGKRFHGPGIRDVAALRAGPLPDGFWSWWRANGRLYPEGVDLVLVAPDRLAALPRSAMVEG